jgi:hypothetical protein
MEGDLGLNWQEGGVLRPGGRCYICYFQKLGLAADDMTWDRKGQR